MGRIDLVNERVDARKPIKIDGVTYQSTMDAVNMLGIARTKVMEIRKKLQKTSSGKLSMSCTYKKEFLFEEVKVENSNF